MEEKKKKRQKNMHSYFKFKSKSHLFCCYTPESLSSFSLLLVNSTWITNTRLLNGALEILLEMKLFLRFLLLFLLQLLLLLLFLLLTQYKILINGIMLKMHILKLHLMSSSSSSSYSSRHLYLNNKIQTSWDVIQCWVLRVL